MIIQPIDIENDTHDIFAFRNTEEWVNLRGERGFSTQKDFTNAFTRTIENNSISSHISRTNGNVVSFSFLEYYDHCSKHAYLIHFVNPIFRKNPIGMLSAFYCLFDGFHFFGLRKIYSDCYAFNTASIKVLSHDDWWEKEGEFTEHFYLGGKFHNLHRYSMKCEKYEKVSRYKRCLEQKYVLKYP